VGDEAQKAVSADRGLTIWVRPWEQIGLPEIPPEISKNDLFIAGIVTIYERPYALGDRITIGDAYGEVTSVGLRSVQILTPDDTRISVPHARTWDTNIHNANAGKRDQLCVADFFLHSEHDARAARQALLDVIVTSPYLQMERPLAVMVAEKPWGTHYRLKAYPVDGRDEFSFITE